MSPQELHDLSALLRRQLPDAPVVIPNHEADDVFQLVRNLGDFRAGLAEARAQWPEGARYYEEDDETLGFPDHLHIWEQDGPSLISPSDEQWIEATLWARFFSDKYRRGPWPDLLAIAEWLEERFPEGEIWYGGDSSGHVASHLTAELKVTYSRAFLRTD